MDRMRVSGLVNDPEPLRYIPPYLSIGVRFDTASLLYI